MITCQPKHARVFDLHIQMLRLSYTYTSICSATDLHLKLSVYNTVHVLNAEF